MFYGTGLRRVHRGRDAVAAYNTGHTAATSDWRSKEESPWNEYSDKYDSEDAVWNAKDETAWNEDRAVIDNAYLDYEVAEQIAWAEYLTGESDVAGAICVTIDLSV